ncbi:MAG: LysR family transcriptional regulator [Rhodospirillales bacterium]|nr:LysR family transcriptional regulator [Rhodospirillales bacterium]MBO6785628.1 LysR family transcriptional regulator [Rhodospirillales bacterium]
MAAPDPLEGMSVFAAVVDAESFTGAARQLRLSKGAVSVQIQKLEDRLGVRLLNRTTRRLSLTDEGRAFYEHCRRILDEAREAVDALDSLGAVPRGVLRINAPMSFGILHLGPAVAEFMHEYPEVVIDMTLNDRQIDVVEEGFDMAIRIARLPDSSLIARRLAPCRRVVMASPEYWDKHGRPSHPSDLKDHDALIYDYLPEPDTWTFKGPEGRFSVTVSGRLRANNGEVLLNAAKRGIGVDLAPTFFCCGEIQSGELEVALTDYEDDPISVYAVYPHRRHLSPRVRAFVDFLADRFGENPYWDQ